MVAYQAALVMFLGIGHVTLTAGVSAVKSLDCTMNGQELSFCSEEGSMTVQGSTHRGEREQQHCAHMTICPHTQTAARGHLGDNSIHCVLQIQSNEYHLLQQPGRGCCVQLHCWIALYVRDFQSEDAVYAT